MAQCAVKALGTTTERDILLGRDDELAALVSGGLDDLLLRQKTGALFLLTGEPGIGKTRLADEVAREAAARGVSVHWGRVWESGGGAPPYWPLIQILRSIDRRMSDHLLLRGGDRFELFDKVTSFLEDVARNRAPLLLVIDDLHAADPSSLELLHFLVRNGLRDRPIMIVGTYREAEARISSLAATLSQIGREAKQTIALRRLERAEVAEYVTRVTGAEDAEERADTIHQRTEGNPLFVRELLRLRTAGHTTSEGIREVVRARLRLLAPEVRLHLEEAAVKGREFARTRTNDDATLKAAQDAEIIEALDADTWRFTHVLLREALYEDLSVERRRSIHLATARELQQSTDDESAPAEIAHHLLRAFAPNQEPHPSIEELTAAVLHAAKRASSVFAFEDASELLSKTWKLFESSPAADKGCLFEVLLALGIARILSNNVHAGKKNCARAIDVARSLDDGELFARAVLGSSIEFVPGIRDLELIALLEEALTRLPPGDGALRARCLAQLAAERQPEPDTEPPMALAREAIAMARRLDDPDTLLYTLSNGCLALLIFADAEERLPLNLETLRLSLLANDLVRAARAQLLLGSDYLQLGDRQSLRSHWHAYDELVRPREVRYRWVPIAHQASDALWLGEFAKAEQLYLDANTVSLRYEGRGAELHAFRVGLITLAEREQADVDPSEIEPQIRTTFGAIGSLESCIGEMLIAQLRGRDIANVDRATTQLATVKAHPIYPQIKEPTWLALLVDACHLTNDLDLAKQLYSALLPRAKRFHWMGPVGGYTNPPYGRFCGLLAGMLGLHEEAIAHFEDCEKRVAAAEMHSSLARVRFELARALLVRGKPEERARAANLLASAHELATSLDQRLLLSQIAGIREGESAPSKSAAPPAAVVTFTMQREGEYWTITTSGTDTLRLRNSRGLALLDTLLTHRGQELHVLQLVGAESSASESEDVDNQGDAGPVLDSKAVNDYRQRLLDLREELEEAQSFSDAGRTERARREMELLTQELARAVGLGGRERRVGGAAERARTMVQKRLRTAIRHIEDGLPSLGRHLDQTIKTGAFCGYLPDGRRRRR
jgi:hypothetical protein